MRVLQETADRARSKWKVSGKGSSWKECGPDTGKDTGKDLKRQEEGGEGRGGGTFPLTIQRQAPLRNMKEHHLLYPPATCIAALTPKSLMRVYSETTKEQLNLYSKGVG